VKVYLSGAIEHASDGGRAWRRQLAAFLRGDLGHEVYDPAADEKKCLTEEELRDYRRWKTEAPDRFREVIRKIIAWDLDLIEKETDYVIALWDEASARGGGTAAEITLAHRLGKPVFVLLGMPVREASGWVLAAADEISTTFEELKGQLRERFGPLPGSKSEIRNPKSEIPG